MEFLLQLLSYYFIILVYSFWNISIFRSRPDDGDFLRMLVMCGTVVSTGHRYRTKAYVWNLNTGYLRYSFNDCTNLRLIKTTHC